MRIARQIAWNNNACYSRQIGSVIVNPKMNTLISTGYNGPPAGTPHTDDPEYLKMLWNTLMSDEDKKRFRDIELGTPYDTDVVPWDVEKFVECHGNCGKCPRRIMNIPSGERLELCICLHSEENSIINAAKAGSSTHDCYIFCWCGVPCHECSKKIINAGISKVYCLDTGNDDYSKHSRWLLEKAGVGLFFIKEEDVGGFGGLDKNDMDDKI